MSPYHRGFTIILRHTTFGRTPLDERQARRRDIYLTTNTRHSQQTDRHAPTGLEPTVSASQRPQTHAVVGNGNCQIFSLSFTGLDDCLDGTGGNGVCGVDVVIFPRGNGFTIHSQFDDRVA